MTTPSTTGKHVSVTGKEDGELSASDDEVQPMQTSTRAPLTEHVSVPSANIQRPQAGNGGSLIKPVDATTPLKLTHHKGQIVEKKQAASIAAKPAIHGKKFSVRSNNNNLVINFSDDDSGSESDGKGRTQTSKIQPKGTISGNRNLSPLLQTKLKGPRQIDNRAIKKKALSTSTFSHAATSKVSNLSIPKEMKSNKNIPISERTVSKDTRRPEQNVEPNSNKLQDLRQQIALRESELKLKAAHPKKDGTNQKISPARKLGMVSDDAKQQEPKEPAKKRLKVTGTDTSQPVIDYRVPASSVAPMKAPGIQSLLPGINANSSCKHLGSNSNVIALPVVSQHIVEGNTSSSVLQQSTSKANHYEGVRCGQPDFSVHMTSRELERMKNVDRSVSNDQLLEMVNGNHQPYLNSSGLWNIPGNTTAPGHSQLDMVSLTNLEETLDRELEEAQERKRLCEIEERNALKVYRKAQRSLIEANARCAELYSKRETLSAHYGSLIVRDSRLLWPSVHHEHPESGFHFLNNNTENVDLATKTDITQHTHLESNHKYNNEYGASHPPPHSGSGQNLGSQPCSDLDASTSDGLPCSNKQTASRLCSPTSDANILPDDESFPVDHESTEGDLGHQMENLEQTLGNQNSMLLEASLRSKLFERLGPREESRGGTCLNGETSIDKGDDSDAASDRTQRDGSSPFSEKYQHNDSREPDTSTLQGSPSEAPVEQRTIEESTIDMDSHRISPENDLLSSVALSGPLFRSTINHLKVPGSSITSLGLEYTLQNKSYCLCSDERERRSLIETPVYGEKIGLYTCNLKVDPFWPLCMYELRGRCNNDECSWQHFKDFSDDSLHRSLHNPPDGTVGSSLHQKKHNSSRGSPTFDAVLLPTYLACLDTMKVDSWSYESILAQRYGQIWWKHFTLCLASSNLFYKNIPARENEGRIEVLGNSRTYSSYFRIKHSLMNLLKQGSDAAIEPVEMALIIFSQEVDQSEGLIQALSVLSRGLEGDPASEILWTVYLLIYYAYEGSDGRDMLSYGVKLSSGSYVLWLMYISNRGQLTDQLIAYDAALSALCNHASGSIDRDHASACILDVLLQMFNVLCISGNVSKAIQRISKLQAPAAVSDDPEFSLMSHILTCLTYSDKSVFWVCCVYLVIYRKLPDPVVQRLEMEKELLEIEWPSVNLEGDLKQMALRLFDKGMHSVEHCSNDGRSEIGTARLLLALNRVLFMVAVDELENCRDILKASIEVYPTCLELKLLAARMQPNESKDAFSSGFEELLKQEPKKASGIQCIWNQYAEYALQEGSYDLARELMSRWYVSVWDVLSHKNKTVVANGEGGDDSLLESALSDLSVASDQRDAMFGYLNLSLHNVLQSNWSGARLAIDQALKATAPEHFMYCLREHAVFQIINELQATGEFSINQQLRLLKSYLDQASPLPVKEPLSWKFISNSAEKPRVRKLVTNLLAPISSELVVVNVVLEAWHGASLVPEKLSKQKELVDFVETILGLVPCNYPLALSVSKLLRKEERHSDSGSSSGIHFWAGLNLVNTISCAIPIAPEYIWVEAGDILSNINGLKTRAERFLKKALSVYPMSVKLWRCYRSLCRSIEERRVNEIDEAARKKGITLD